MWSVQSVNEFLPHAILASRIRLTGAIPDGLEQGLRFTDGRSMAEMDRPFGPERLHVFQRLPQNIFVKEEDGVEGLILGAGGQITTAGQVGEEMFKFLFAGKGIRHGIEGADVTAQPKNV